MEVDAKYKDIIDKIKFYENQGDFKAALSLCARVEYADVPTVQSERLFILIKLDHIAEAYNVFKRIKYMKESYIQSKGIKILSKLGRHDELKQLIMENGNIEDTGYKLNLVKYYRSIKEYDKALTICNEPFCASQVVFKEHKKNIKNLKYRSKAGFAYEALMRIYADDITLDEIKNADIVEEVKPDASDIEKIEAEIMKQFKKDVLMIAYYEKHSHKQAIEKCKLAKKNINYDQDQIKSLNKIMNHLASKRSKMDYDLYKNILGVSFDLEKAHKYMEEKKEQQEYQELMNRIIKKNEEKEKQTIRVDNIANKETIEKTKKLERKMVGSVGVNVNNRYSNNSNINTPIHTPTKTVPCIKDVLGDEIISLQKYIYCMMQDYSYYKDANNTWQEIKDIACKPITKKSKYTLDEEEKLKKGFNKMKTNYIYYDKTIRAWDNLDSISNKPITDKQAVARIVNILLSINNDHPEIIEADTDKLVKMLNK